MYYVIYENSRTRKVSSSYDTIEECQEYIKRAKILDIDRGESFIYYIVKTI